MAEKILYIAIKRPPTLTETFIRAHLDRLPARILPIYGHLGADGKPVGRPALPVRAYRAFCDRYFTLSVEALVPKDLRRFLRHSGGVALLAEYGMAGVRMMYACQDVGVPLIVHFHGYDAYADHVMKAEGKQYPALFSIAAAHVVVSRHMQQQLIQLGAPPDRVHLCPYGVDVSKFIGGGPATAAPHFVAVGRFVEKKAPHLTILAFSRVRKECPKACLTMVGDGRLLGPCRHLVKALGLGDSVQLPGPAEHDQIAGLMLRARAFVQHSVQATSGDCEGMPLAILEAGASGLPVVATRHGGIQDVVLEGETGLLVDEHDIDEMARNMTLLANDPGLAGRLGGAARRRITAEFGVERHIKNLWNIIQSVI